MSNLKLHPLHYADLQKSGLSDETIEAAGIVSVPPNAIRKRLGYDPPSLTSMYEIPYGGGFSRYRCFYSEGKIGPKYLQKRDTGNRLYIPALAPSILTDTAKPLFITEGEKKALKACQEGIPCVGLAGLWNWKIKDGGLIPDFERIILQGRKVFMIPDNDYLKPNKHGYDKNLGKAVNDLAESLIEKGAMVSVIQLPDGPEKGLDDYLLSHTVAEFRQLPARNVSVPNVNDKKKKQQVPTKTERLIDLALKEVELFHDEDLKAYATTRRDGHRETYLIRSRGFRTWLSGLLWKESREGCGVQIMQDALGTLEGYAIHEGSCHAVHVRLAEHSGRLYLDLGSDRFDVVEIDPDGWRVLENQNIVKFRRPSGMAALPYPQNGGNIEVLKRYVNLSNPEDWPLIVGFIVGCFHPAGPYPILDVTGEQGSAKSTLLRLIKAIIDPCTATLRSAPKELRDLAISANNTWVLAFDNLSDIPGWLSDGLCRLATGGGFATRTLYSDDEETIFDTKRPVMLNGIDNVIRRHDLADRAMIVNLAVIQEERRIPEKEFWDDFKDDAPEILGVLLDAVSLALRNVDSVKLDSYPRMADFVTWVTAAEPAFGWKPGTFLKAYRQNIREVRSLTLDADLVGSAVKTFIESRSYETWDGTSSELLDALDGEADDRTKKGRGWPQSANSLSGKLKRSATALRTEGIEVTIGRVNKRRTIRLEHVGKKIDTIVTDSKITAQTDDITNLSKVTMFDGKIVTGSSSTGKDRHQFGMSDDGRDDGDDALRKIVTNIHENNPVKAISYKQVAAGDGGDDDSPPPFQSDNLREVTL